jgi:hypothetical protein
MYMAFRLQNNEWQDLAFRNIHYSKHRRNEDDFIRD